MGFLLNMNNRVGVGIQYDPSDGKCLKLEKGWSE